MAINFPVSTDVLTNPIATNPQNNPSHSAQHANANDAIEALETKVGVDSSAVTTSLDYKVANRTISPALNTADYIPQWNGANSKTLKDGLAVPAGGLAGLTALGLKADTSALASYLPLAGGTMTGGIVNSTSLNPLTTLAESWIGPSSTTGVYLKAGNVGIGTTAPRYKNTTIGVVSSLLSDDATNYEGLTITPTAGNITLAAVTAGTGTDNINIVLTPAGTGINILANAQVTSLTASQILGTDASKNIVSLPVATYPSLTELSYVKGVTSAIQTQLGTKMANPMTTGGDLIYGGASGAPTRLVNGTAGYVLQSNGTTLAPTWVAAGAGDMILASVQSVTGLKTFDTIKLAVKGSSTGSTAIASANAGVTDYTLTIPAVTGTTALGTGTINEIAYWSATNVLGTLAVVTYPSLTELSYVKGLSSAIQTQLNGKQASGTYSTDIHANITALNAVSGTNTGDQTNISGNAATVTTNANLTGDVTSVGNATTLTNAPVIAKVLTGYVSGAGTVAATDSILQAIQKINGNDALKAPLASPTFTGTPSLPTGTTGVTQSANTNNTTIATTAYVDGKASGSSLWTLMPGTPTRVGNTSFTVTGDITAYVAKGMIIKWTETSVVRCAMVSIPSTYGAPNTTITIVGDVMASIDASSLKYCMLGVEMFIKNFVVVGTLGVIGTDIANAYYATEPMRVLGVDLQVGTAGTTNSTTIDINKGGVTMFTTKPTLATTVASSPTPFTADTTSALALADRVSIDIDAIQTTAAIDLYVQLYTFPVRYLSLS